MTLSFIVLFSALFAVTTQTATYEDVQLQRVVRSPHYGGYFSGPPPFFPPPPPFIYHTHNWSGVGRNNDGSVGKVFSGAAATAGNPVPNLSGAFSLAEAGSSGSTDCDDNSQSSGVKGTEKYTSQSSSQLFGSASTGHVSQTDYNAGGSFNAKINSHINLKDSTPASSQFGQNSALSDFGQQSSGGYGDQALGINSEHAKHYGGYGGYVKNFKESHYFNHRDNGNEFGSQASNSRNIQGSSNHQPQDLSTSSNNEEFPPESTQSGLSTLVSNPGTFSGRGQSSGLNGQQVQVSSFDNNGNAEAFSRGSAQHDLSFGKHGNFGSSSQEETQISSSALGANQGSFSGSGESSFGGFGRRQVQDSPSGSNGNFGAFSQNSEQSGSSVFGWNPRSYSGDEHSNFSGFGNHQDQGSSSGNFGAFSQASAQSGTNSFGSTNNNSHSDGRGFGISKSQAGVSETYKSEQLQSAPGSEQTSEYEAGLGGGQTSTINENSAAGYGQHQSTLHGALELAAQGLQAADQTKCSTCQKSSYALSNAKSHNGAAIALSIGG